MHCRNDIATTAANPRQAVSYSCYFLNVLTGRLPAAKARLYATPEGWSEFARICKRVPTRFRQVRVLRAHFPSPTAAEIVAMVENGRDHRAMTLTFTATPHGWRLNHCDLIDRKQRLRI